MSSDNKMKIDNEEVDEKLYSRQLYVMGHEAQTRLQNSKLLLLGCGGLGVEVAKNTILAGLKEVVVWDPYTPTVYDYNANFYLDPASATITKADQCVVKLAELNPYVSVSVMDSTILDIDQIVAEVANGAFTAICITLRLSEDDLVKLNNAARASNTKFIYGVVSGVYSLTFCDFGDEFVISDTDGEQPHSSMVETIIVGNDGSKLHVKVLEDTRHNLESGDVVTFSKTHNLLNGQNFVIEKTSPNSFDLVCVDSMEVVLEKDQVLATSGYITQVKQPVTKSHKALTSFGYDGVNNNNFDVSSIADAFLLSDFGKFDSSTKLHRLYQVLSSKNGVFENVNIFKQAAKDRGVSLKDIDEPTIQKFVHGYECQLSPMCAAVGGIIGQECLKACSGKFTPVSQFLYLDYGDVLPDTLPTLTSNNGGFHERYTSQVKLFGPKVQDNLLKYRGFLVGAGAIGCEMMKNWALMGVGCSSDGIIHVTDMDRIEKSNLSRQFLFRNSDIDCFKSETAARRAKEFNADMNIVHYTEKVAPDTEELFSDAFYAGLSGICTALDNVEARLYIDTKCVYHGLPMLESGTLGTKGNTQIVVPFLTENYGATRDPPEKSIPVCTLKNFPNLIQHTLQWARDEFEGIFSQAASDVNQYLSTPSAEYKSQLQSLTNKLEVVKNVKKTLVDERPTRYEDCVVWARLKFEELFHNSIAQLLYNFPPDQVTSSGNKFWSGSKRCPKPLSFNIDDVCSDAEMRNHYNFIMAAANLRAKMFGIIGKTEEEFFRQFLPEVIVPDFTPRDGVKISANEAEEESKNSSSLGGDEWAECEAILAELPAPSSLAGFRLDSIDFDKDIDEHMDFVTACSNCRALNYSIPTEDVHRSRAIAGRIIPAIATTTALVTGLISMELYKLVNPDLDRKIELFRSGFLNLAIPFMTLSEPTAPKGTVAKVKGEEWKWTAWDSLALDCTDKELTLEEFIEYFKNKYNIEVTMLSHGVSILFSFFMNQKKVAERMPMKMSELVELVTKKPLGSKQSFINFEIIANDVDNEDDEVDLPYVKYRFR